MQLHPALLTICGPEDLLARCSQKPVTLLELRKAPEHTSQLCGDGCLQQPTTMLQQVRVGCAWPDHFRAYITNEL